MKEGQLAIETDRGAASYFTGRLGVDAQRMNGALHQIAGSIKNQTLPGQAGLSGKLLGFNVNQEMAAAPSGTRMAGMPLGVVGNVQPSRAQLREAQPQLVFDIHAGKTFRNGLTVTFA